jgi:UDP-N-acetylmuramoyl-L-alanyl-D-glutamate--2,6-diaminopimelate ligase
MQGCPSAIEIGDRAEAIAVAIGKLRGGDVLLVAGKGHESGQIVGSTVVPFNDVDAVRSVSGVRA